MPREEHTLVPPCQSVVPGRLTWPVPMVVAHRANAPNVPENSLAGIRANREIGSDLVELDVRRSVGGTPFLLHNWYLGQKRRRGNWPVRVTPGRFLQRLVLADSDGEHLPTLDEALSLIASGPSFPGPALHVKDQGGVRTAMNHVRHHHLCARTWMWVHRPESVRLARSMCPESHVTLVEGNEKTRRQFSAFIEKAAQAGADAVSLPWWALVDGTIAEACGRGLGVVAMIHDLETVVPLVREGLTGVITDYPEVVTERLRAAGLRDDRPEPGSVART